MTLIVLLVVLACIFGYITNILKLFTFWWEGCGMKVLRVVGIFFPLIGAILGFIGE